MLNYCIYPQAIWIFFYIFLLYTIFIVILILYLGPLLWTNYKLSFIGLRIGKLFLFSKDFFFIGLIGLFIIKWFLSCWSFYIYSAWFGHLICGEFQFFIINLLTNLFILLFLIYKIIFWYSTREINDYIITCFFIYNWSIFLFFSNSLFTTIFFFEIISISVFLLFLNICFSSYNIRYNAFLYVNRRYSSFFILNYYLNSLIFYYWISFIASVGMFIFLSLFLINFCSFEWFFINLIFIYETQTLIKFDLFYYNIIWYFFLMFFFIKIGLSPIYLWKPLFLKGLPTYVLFFYLIFYYTSILIYFLFLLNNYFSPILIYFNITNFIVTFSGILLLFFSISNIFFFKSFLGFSSMINSLLLILFSFLIETSNYELTEFDNYKHSYINLFIYDLFLEYVHIMDYLHELGVSWDSICEFLDIHLLSQDTLNPKTTTLINKNLLYEKCINYNYLNDCLLNIPINANLIYKFIKTNYYYNEFILSIDLINKLINKFFYTHSINLDVSWNNKLIDKFFFIQNINLNVDWNKFYFYSYKENKIFNISFNLLLDLLQQFVFYIKEIKPFYQFMGYYDFGVDVENNLFNIMRLNNINFKQILLYNFIDIINYLNYNSISLEILSKCLSPIIKNIEIYCGSGECNVNIMNYYNIILNYYLIWNNVANLFNIEITPRIIFKSTDLCNIFYFNILKTAFSFFSVQSLNLDNLYFNSYLENKILLDYIWFPLDYLFTPPAINIIDIEFLNELIFLLSTLNIEFDGVVFNFFNIKYKIKFDGVKPCPAFNTLNINTYQFYCSFSCNVFNLISSLNNNTNLNINNIKTQIDLNLISFIYNMDIDNSPFLIDLNLIFNNFLIHIISYSSNIHNKVIFDIIKLYYNFYAYINITVLNPTPLLNYSFIDMNFDLFSFVTPLKFNTLNVDFNVLLSNINFIYMFNMTNVNSIAIIPHTNYIIAFNNYSINPIFNILIPEINPNPPLNILSVDIFKINYSFDCIHKFIKVNTNNNKLDTINTTVFSHLNACCGFYFNISEYKLNFLINYEMLYNNIHTCAIFNNNFILNNKTSFDISSIDMLIPSYCAVLIFDILNIDKIISIIPHTTNLNNFKLYPKPIFDIDKTAFDYTNNLIFNVANIDFNRIMGCLNYTVIFDYINPCFNIILSNISKIDLNIIIPNVSFMCKFNFLNVDANLIIPQIAYDIVVDNVRVYPIISADFINMVDFAKINYNIKCSIIFNIHNTFISNLFNIQNIFFNLNYNNMCDYEKFNKYINKYFIDCYYNIFYNYHIPTTHILNNFNCVDIVYCLSKNYLIHNFIYKYLEIGLFVPQLNFLTNYCWV